MTPVGLPPMLIRDDATGRIAGEARGVDLHAAVHVIGVLAAIEHEAALVDDRAGHAAVGRDARLQGHERGRRRGQWKAEFCKSSPLTVLPTVAFKRLKFGARGDRHFHGFSNRTEFQRDVQGQRRTDIHDLVDEL